MVSKRRDLENKFNRICREKRILLNQIRSLLRVGEIAQVITSGSSDLHSML